MLLLWSARSRTGWLVAGTLVVLSGLGLLAGLANEVRYELGYAGQPGRLRITHCVTTGSGKTKRTSCQGTFTLDDRSVVDEPQTVDWDYPAGAVVPAQRQPDGSLSETGWKTASFTIAGAFFGLLMAGAGTHGLATTSRRFAGKQAGLSEQDLVPGHGRHARPGLPVAPLPQPQRAFSVVGGTLALLGLLGAVVMFCVGFSL